MVGALIITLREGIEAALVVGILVAYLKRINREELNRYVYAGLILAVFASLLGAVVLKLLNIDPENEVMEGSLLLTAALFVGTMVIWMQRTGKHLKERMEKRVQSLLQEETAQVKKGIFSLSRQSLGLFALAFLLVFREGIETVLFLEALSSGATAKILPFIGGFIGLGAAVLFGVLFVKGSLRIDLKRFFSVTSVILLLLVIKLLAGGIHEFIEVGILPTNRTALYIIGLLVRERASIMILIALLTLPVFMILLDAWKKKVPVVSREETPAQRRKRLAATLRERRWKIAAAAITLIIIFGLSTALGSTQEVYDPPSRTVVAKDGQVRLLLSSLKDNRLHKYIYNSDGIEIEFLLIKREAGRLGSAFDACQVCGTYGYLQGNGQVICKNCEAPIAISTIGQPGGCNPVPLKATVTSSQVIIRVEDLDRVGRILFGP